MFLFFLYFHHGDSDEYLLVRQIPHGKQNFLREVVPADFITTNHSP